MVRILGCGNLALPPTETYILTSVSSLRIHVLCTGEAQRWGIAHMGSSARFHIIFVERKWMPQNNSLTFWRPRFMQTVSVTHVSFCIRDRSSSSLLDWLLCEVLQMTFGIRNT
jgi:hypothetical protein